MAPSPLPNPSSSCTIERGNSTRVDRFGPSFGAVLLQRVGDRQQRRSCPHDGASVLRLFFNWREKSHQAGGEFGSLFAGWQRVKLFEQTLADQAIDGGQTLGVIRFAAGRQSCLQAGDDITRFLDPFLLVTLSSRHLGHVRLDGGHCCFLVIHIDPA